MSLIKCVKCGGEISDKSKTCVHCGEIIDSDLSEKNDTNIKSISICPSCGISINDDTRICNECGFIIETIEKENINTEENINSIEYENPKGTQTKNNSALMNIILIAGTIIFSIFSIAFFTQGFNVKNDYLSNRYVGGDAYNFIINGTYFTGYTVLGSSCMICAILLLVTLIIIQQKKGE